MEHFEVKKRGENVDTVRKRFQKSDLRYWEARVRKTVRSSSYSVSLQHGGIRRELSLRCGNIHEAGRLAKEYYQFLVANGWQALLKKYRPEQQPLVIPGDQLTVGQYLQAVREKSDLDALTIAGYAVSLRTIISQMHGLRQTDKKAGPPPGPQYAELIAKIEAMPLSRITPDKIRAWEKTYVARAATNEVLRRQYQRTASSFIRRAKALFGRKVLPRLAGSVELPKVLPFDGIVVKQITSKFYNPGINPHELLAQALDELSTDRVEQLKIVLLALGSGLRRREISWLEWSSFDFQNATLRIMPTRYFAPKTEESLATLPLERPIAQLFQGWRARATGPFVVESERPAKAVPGQFYRCGPVFDGLRDWLRSKNVHDQKPIHFLRKLHGAIMADLFGVFAASKSLRHSDLRTTSEFYVDSRARLTPNFSIALSGKVLPLPKPEPDPVTSAIG